MNKEYKPSFFDKGQSKINRFLMKDNFFNIFVDKVNYFFMKRYSVVVDFKKRERKEYLNKIKNL